MARLLCNYTVTDRTGFAAGIGTCNVLKAELWAVRCGLRSRPLNLKVILFEDQWDLEPNAMLRPWALLQGKKKEVLKSNRNTHLILFYS